jgi:DNA repair protein RadC
MPPSQDDPVRTAAASPRPVRCPRVGEPSPAHRPFEKLQRHGERALSNTDLLAVTLGAGSRDHNVLKVAEGLLRKYGFEALPNLSLNEWQSNKGIGPAKACRLKAIFELGRRAFSPKDDDRPALSGPREAYHQVRDLRKARKEHLVALYLDAQNYLIRRETISVGSLNTTRTHPREILHPAILHSALAFLLVHNHPSGSLEPSRDDLDFTRSIARAGELIGIALTDHLIVSPKGYVSMKERGVL